MIGVDKVLAAKEERTRLRKGKEAQRRQRLEEPGPSVSERVWCTDEEEDLKEAEEEMGEKKACPQLLRLLLPNQSPSELVTLSLFLVWLLP